MNLVRVEQIEGLTSLIINSTNDAVSNYLPLSGGIITGNLRLGYLSGTNLRGLFVDEFGNIIASNDDFPTTRIRSNTNAYLSGNITLTAGTNTTLTQNGNIITINATDTNTTYTAGNGLNLSGTTFSLPVTVSGSGTYVQSVTQTTNGLTVTLGTPSDNNTTYTAGSGLTLSGTQFSLPVTVSGTGTYVQSVTQTTNGISVILGTPPNTDTTYSVISVAEVTNTTNSTGRLISGQRLYEWSTNSGVYTSLGLHNIANQAYSTKTKNGVTYWDSGTSGMYDTSGVSLHISPIGKAWYNRLDFGNNRNYIDVWRGLNTTVMSRTGIIPILESGTVLITTSNINSYVSTSAQTRIRSNSNSYVSGDVTLNAGSNVSMSQSGNVITINAANTNTDTITRLKSNGNALLTGDITLTAGSNVSLTQSGNTITINATNTNTVTRLRGNSNPYVSGDITLTAGANITITQSNNVISISGVDNYFDSDTIYRHNHHLYNNYVANGIDYVGDYLRLETFDSGFQVYPDFYLSMLNPQNGIWEEPKLDMIGAPFGLVSIDRSLVLLKGFIFIEPIYSNPSVSRILTLIFDISAQSLSWYELSPNQYIEYKRDTSRFIVYVMGRYGYDPNRGCYFLHFNPTL